jgi:hypothetical protein
MSQIAGSVGVGNVKWGEEGKEEGRKRGGFILS